MMASGGSMMMSSKSSETYAEFVPGSGQALLTPGDSEMLIAEQVPQGGTSAEFVAESGQAVWTPEGDLLMESGGHGEVDSSGSLISEPDGHGELTGEVTNDGSLITEPDGHGELTNDGSLITEPGGDGQAEDVPQETGSPHTLPSFAAGDGGPSSPSEQLQHGGGQGAGSGHGGGDTPDFTTQPVDEKQPGQGGGHPGEAGSGRHDHQGMAESIRERIDDRIPDNVVEQLPPQMAERIQEWQGHGPVDVAQEGGAPGPGDRITDSIHPVETASDEIPESGGAHHVSHPNRLN